LWQVKEEREERDTADWISKPALKPMSQALSWLLAPLVVLALLSWTLHVFHVCFSLGTTRTLHWLMGSGEAAVALLAALLLIAAGIRQAWYSQQARWIYGIAVLGGMVGVYVRVLLIGLAPVGVWDTVTLISAAYALFIVQRLAPSEPILHVVMVLPLLALGTVPLQLASLHASGTLLTIGTLYLGIRRATGQPLPLYIGLLTLNSGIYLWVPDWANQYHVIQVYTIPVAASVLWLLHLHHHELHPKVLHSSRLAAICTLYVSATLDVFLRPELTVFVAVLVLSLAGILIGIALRTRAFLYAGITFFVLNIVGQVILLFPEQRLGKAIVLLVLASVIASVRIWFDAQREAILQRIRIFRADLARWA
jgi:hypothetical protein